MFVQETGQYAVVLSGPIRAASLSCFHDLDGGVWPEVVIASDVTVGVDPGVAMENWCWPVVSPTPTPPPQASPTPAPSLGPEDATCKIQAALNPGTPTGTVAFENASLWSPALASAVSHGLINLAGSYVVTLGSVVATTTLTLFGPGSTGASLVLNGDARVDLSANTQCAFVVPPAPGAVALPVARVCC